MLVALLLSFLYACSDEYHQTIVVGITGEFDDVLIDIGSDVVDILIVSLIDKLNIWK